MTSFITSRLVSTAVAALAVCLLVDGTLLPASNVTSTAGGSREHSWCQDVPPLAKLSNTTEELFVTQLFRNYQKQHRPPNCLDGNQEGSTSPTIVSVNMYVNSISSISVVDMDYSVDVFLRQRWTDSRLRFSGMSSVLSLNYMKERLWIPDLFFRNSKEGRLHTVTTPNHLIWVYPGNGSVLFSQKLSVKLDCPMTLWNFPMDSQVCRIEMGSYGYSLNELDFKWLIGQQVELNSKLQINEFQFPSLKHGTCVKAYNSTGKFACVYLEFHLVRKFGFYLIYTYLPSILVVLLSWISFWIDYQAVPARITLGLLSILALITQAAATLQKLPRVSYVKAIDVWLFACLAFVVLSLLEFSLVNVLARRQQKRRDSDWRTELRRALRQELLATGDPQFPGRAPPPNGESAGGAGDCSGPGGDEAPDSPLLVMRHRRRGSSSGECGGGIPRAAAIMHRGGGGASSIKLHYHHPQQQRQQQQHQQRRRGCCRCLCRGASGSRKRVSGSSPSAETQRGTSGCCWLKPQHVDWFSIFLFPSSFLLFNIIYWLYFLVFSAHQNEGSFHD